MERDINMEFIWSAVDWEPPFASTSPAYTVSSSGTIEYVCIHHKGIKLFTFLAKSKIRRSISGSCLCTKYEVIYPAAD